METAAALRGVGVGADQPAAEKCSAINCCAFIRFYFKSFMTLEACVNFPTPLSGMIKQSARLCVGMEKGLLRPCSPSPVSGGRHSTEGLSPGVRPLFWLTPSLRTPAAHSLPFTDKLGNSRGVGGLRAPGVGDTNE